MNSKNGPGSRTDAQNSIGLMLYRRWIHRRERHLSLLDTNRQVLPFEWGLDWLPRSSANGRDPLEHLQAFAEEALRGSEAFFSVPSLKEWRFNGERLHFESPLRSLDDFNNQASFRYFPAEDSERAVIVIPQWNADQGSHVALCRIFAKLGISVLRHCLPYHEERLPPNMLRADYMVSPNLGRTLQTTRQAVLEVRQAIDWLIQRGYRRIGVAGTSIGSCVGYLAFVHDSRLRTGVFNHVSSFFADVVWTGLSTRFVKWGLKEHIELEELRKCWAPISPYYFVHRLASDERPHRLITASYDLTFRPELSELVFEAYRKVGASCDRVDLPCGHYTTAHFPFSYLDGWYICSFMRRHL